VAGLIGCAGLAFALAPLEIGIGLTILVAGLAYRMLRLSLVADADKAFLRKAHGHLSATARELALASSTGSFPPKPSRWQCQRCDFRTVCDEGRAAAIAD
jgi:hypothetical protein